MPGETCQAKPEAIFEVISNIVNLCIDGDLIERQREHQTYHPEYAPIDNDVEACLASIGLKHTKIGNVQKIRRGTRIRAGAQIGNHCIINARVHIFEAAEVGDYALLDHGCGVGPFSVIERGATLLPGSAVGDNCIIGEGAEVNYDLSIGDSGCVKPFHIATHSADNNQAYSTFSK